MTSKHYTETRKRRENAIKKIGLGKVVFTTVKYDYKKHRHFKYEITDTAILIVKATDEEDFIITKIIARPSRITKYWEDAPQEIIELAIKHSRQGYTF